MLESALGTTIKQQYPRDLIQKEGVDFIQRELECCGARGPSDWASSQYNQETIEIGVSKLAGIASAFRVPESCCRQGIAEQICKNYIRNVAAIGSLPGTIYTRGCSDALSDYLDEGLNIVAGIGIGIAVVELLGMILSMVLCCAIFRKENYKP